MFRKLTGLVSCGLIVGCATAAHAQSDDAWYVGAGLLGVKAEDSTLKSGGARANAEMDWGWGALVSVGRTFGPLRPELELGWRKNDVDKVGGVSVGGDVNAYTLMANLFYDIKTGSAWTPYIGAGLGGAYLDASSTFQGRKYSGDDTVFAYQGIAGVAYALSDALSIKADYRYLDTMEGNLGGTPNVKGDYTAHSILVGFTYKFGPEKKAAPPAPAPAPVAQPAPPPPPPPAAQPQAARPAEPVRNYLVFFDFDKSAITPEAQSIINQAASAAKAGRSVRIELTGHADRAGSDKYNMGLSKRRADAVKDQLVKMGIQANSIGVSAKGESAPLVPTADGVREPQNRRVEIVLQ